MSFYTGKTTSFLHREVWPVLVTAAVTEVEEVLKEFHTSPEEGKIWPDSSQGALYHEGR